MSKIEKGITFEVLEKGTSFHSYRNYQLYLTKKEIGKAEPKVELLDVPGADEPLDFTEFFGDVKYKNRKLKFTFSVKLTALFDAVFSQLQNDLNGKKCKIILDDDPQFYYIGRVTISELKTDKRIGEITVECDCNPYKLKKNKTVVSVNLSGEKVVTLENLRKHVTPVFKSNATIQVIFGDKQFSSNGTFTIPEIVLKEGSTQIRLKGTANVTVEYQEGGL